MTQTQQAWLELYGANTEVNGAQTATITRDGSPVTTSKRAIISEITEDEILAAGGTAENGGYHLQMFAPDFGIQPEKFDDVEVFGPTIPNSTGLKIINVNNNNGIIYIDAGDFVSKEGG